MLDPPPHPAATALALEEEKNSDDGSVTVDAAPIDGQCAGRCSAMSGPHEGQLAQLVGRLGVRPVDTHVVLVRARERAQREGEEEGRTGRGKRQGEAGGGWG